MRNRIAKAAVANNRTMNAELVDRIEKSFIPGSSNSVPTAVADMSAFVRVLSGTYDPILARLGKVLEQLEKTDRIADRLEKLQRYLEKQRGETKHD